MTMRSPQKDQDTTLGMVMAAVTRLEGRVNKCVDLCTDTNTRVTRVEDRMEALDRRRAGDSYDEITGVESMEELSRAARTMRARAASEELQRQEAERVAQRWKKIGAAIAGIAAGGFAALEVLRASGVLK